MLVQTLELSDVRFLGYITDEQKIEYLRTADLFCSPALYGESFGVVLLEAMATGIVTVAGNNPGYASTMRGLGSVSIVDPKDNEEFARRLELLLQENELRKLWRNWAKEEVEQYNFTHVVSQYEELYEEGLIKRGRKRRGLRGALTKVK
jgi:phosphatidylinositol alpha-mannosyltransferase